MLTIPFFLEHPDAESFTTITTCTSRIARVPSLDKTARCLCPNVTAFCFSLATQSGVTQDDVAKQGFVNFW